MWVYTGRLIVTSGFADYSRMAVDRRRLRLHEGQRAPEALQATPIAGGADYQCLLVYAVDSYDTAP